MAERRSLVPAYLTKKMIQVLHCMSSGTCP